MSAAPGTMSAAAIADAVKSGKTTARAATEEALARLQAAGPGGPFNAVTALLSDRALAKADAVDAKHRAGVPLGPLAGVPFGAKDLFDITGIPTRAGSKINRSRPAAVRDAALIERLEDADAVLVAALHMGEYAYDFTGTNIHDGPARNPHDETRMTGGSSSGPAAIVGGGVLPLAIGSDTNGSIRLPASFCGIYGIKPTYGRLSRAGTFPLSTSLDHVGPFARTLEDLALAYDAGMGPDPRDPVATNRAPEPVGDVFRRGQDGLRVAVAGGYFATGAVPEVRAALESAARTLDATREVDLPESARARQAAFVITAVEAADLHMDRLRTRPQDFDPEVRERMLANAMVPAPFAIHAQKFRRWYREAVLGLFREVDAILAPVAPIPAPEIGQKTFVLDGVEQLIRPNLGLYTQPISFIGLPVVVVPMAISGLPIGVQVIAAPWREDVAMRLAYALSAP